MRSRPALSSPGIWPKTVVALDHAVLHLDGATHGVNYATKLNDAPVAGALHRAPVMEEGNSRVDEVAAEGTQLRKRPLLVCTSKFAVSGLHLPQEWLQVSESLSYQALHHTPD
jgi:hypothetical protein